MDHQYKSKLHLLKKADRVGLIAIDKAHLVTEWADFRGAFSELKELKIDFPCVLIMAVTATATPEVEDGIKQLLRGPVVHKSSVNRPNITMKAEELTTDTSVEPAMQFALKAVEIAGSTSSIIYTDFIADIGPIVSALSDLGVEAVGYLWGAVCANRTFGVSNHSHLI